MNKRYSEWEECHGKIKSRRGQWVIGKGVFNFNFDMMNDLVGNCSYMQVVMLNATGRLPSPELAKWVDASHICLSWPDPRIWCNRIGALAGSSKTSSLLATCMGNLASDSRAYGPKTLVAGLEFMQRALKEVKSGLNVEAFVKKELAAHGGKPKIMGFARPIAKGDERIPAMERVTQDLGFEIGEHLSLAYQIEEILIRDFDETMNINGYMSGFLSDQGLTPHEVYRMYSFIVASGVTACYIDAFERTAGTFAPLKCEDITYTGAKRRPVKTY